MLLGIVSSVVSGGNSGVCGITLLFTQYYDSKHNMQYSSCYCISVFIVIIT